MLYVIYKINSLFMFIALGWVLKFIIPETMIMRITKILFTVGMPIIFFMSIATSNIREELQTIPIIPLTISQTIIFLIALLVANKILRYNKIDAAIFSLASLRSNAILLSYPIIDMLYGQEGTPIVSLGIISAIIYTNIISIGTLEYATRKTVTIKEMVIAIIKMPIIIAALAGIVFSVSGISLEKLEPVYHIIKKPISYTALSLIGTGVIISDLFKNVKSIIIISFLKLIGMPLTIFLTAIIMGYEVNQTLIIILITFSAPTSTALYTMASVYNANREATSSAIAGTTILSFFTYSLILTIFKT